MSYIVTVQLGRIHHILAGVLCVRKIKDITNSN